MAGYIGKSQGVTQVDGYNRTEADGRYVNASGDTMTGALGIQGSTNSGVLKAGTAGTHLTVEVNDGAGEVKLKAQDDSGNNYWKYITFHTEGGSGTLERVRIDPQGRVTMPYQPAFDAVLTSGAAGVQFGANQRIVFNSTNTNIGNHYDTSTGRFTAPVAGLYMFSCTGMTLSTTWFKLLVNDAAIAYPHNPYETGGGTDWASASSTWLISLNASDFVSLHVGSSGVGIYGAGNNHNNFCGYLLG